MFADFFIATPHGWMEFNLCALCKLLLLKRLTKVLFTFLHLTITVIVHCRHRYTGKTAEEAGMVHAARPDAHSTLQEAVKIGMRVPCIYSLGERTKDQER